MTDTRCEHKEHYGQTTYRCTLEDDHEYGHDFEAGYFLDPRTLAMRNRRKQRLSERPLIEQAQGGATCTGSTKAGKRCTVRATTRTLAGEPVCGMHTDHAVCTQCKRPRAEKGHILCAECFAGGDGK